MFSSPLRFSVERLLSCSRTKRAVGFVCLWRRSEGRVERPSPAYGGRTIR